jgi:tetratricopeptide (TPR) repeat protein
MKPTLIKYSDNYWEFKFPSEFFNEKNNNTFWDAVEMLGYDDQTAEIIFKFLINKFPFFIDAYNHLSIAFRNQKKDFESYITAEKAYKIGKECFSKEFDITKDKLIWSCLDNRPFLRSCQIFGLESQLKGDYEKAVELYDEILRLNENDNQGVRFLKLECLFAIKNYTLVRQLLDKLSDDWSIETTYGRVVLEIISDNIELAEKSLPSALKSNRFLPDEIIKGKHKAPPPHRIPGEPIFDAGIPIGSIQQAYEYWNRNKKLFKDKKIIDFFKTRIKTADNKGHTVVLANE